MQRVISPLTVETGSSLISVQGDRRVTEESQVVTAESANISYTVGWPETHEVHYRVSASHRYSPARQCFFNRGECISNEKP